MPPDPSDQPDQSTAPDQRPINVAYLVGIQHADMPPGEGATLLRELRELVGNLQVQIVGETLVALREPSATFLVGRGKMEEIVRSFRESGASLLVFDDELSPAQQRNWEKELQAFAGRHDRFDVTDRQEIILDIFASRARTREAALQVELAQLEYYLPRLKRAWTHLSRQRGGGTGARGQGETQLEVDRRYVKDRIATVRRELEAVVRQRQTQRNRRLRNAVPTAAIVGYTNAGKSTLLNSLTGAGVLAEDKLFATLDPTTRQLQLPSNRRVLVSDTVGFIRRLPTRLVNAFRATLEEVVLADFLVHVVDASSPEAEKHERTTLQVLGEIGAGDKPILTVFNKVDAVADPVRLSLLRALRPGSIAVSARHPSTLEPLIEAMVRAVDAATPTVRMLIPHERYELVARLHALGCVRSQVQTDDGVSVEGVVPPGLAGALAPFVLPGAGD